MKVEEIKLAFETNQKFEFALIDDIRKTELVASNSEDKAIGDLNQGLSIIQKSKTGLDIAIKECQNVLDSIDKAKVMAKELGVDLPDLNSKTKYYQDSISSFKRVQSEISKFDSAVKSIK